MGFIKIRQQISDKNRANFVLNKWRLLNVFLINESIKKSTLNARIHSYQSININRNLYREESSS